MKKDKDLARNYDTAWHKKKRLDSIAQSTCYVCHKTKVSEHKRCDSCLLKAREYGRKQRISRKGANVCAVCKEPLDNLTTWCNKCREKVKIAGKFRRDRIKELVIRTYGGKCACCAESRIEFLSIDHKYNDGNIDRKEHGLSGNSIYVRIRDSGFPEHLQVLCYNCNMAKAFYGNCPHGF